MNSEEQKRFAELLVNSPPPAVNLKNAMRLYSENVATDRLAHEYWYRYRSFRESTGLDEWSEKSSGYCIRLGCFEYRVIKHTPKGVWLQEPYCSGRKFVLKDARKRFACPTKREALLSYIARQKRRLLILKGQTEDSEMGLRVADRMLLKMPETDA
jgi:hypothetical protein